LLLIGCINYINFQTARAALRAHEIGIRKTLGASRGVLMRQMLTEATMISGFALLLALCLVELSLPMFRTLFGVRLSLSHVIHTAPAHFVGGIVALWSAMIMLCGLYPAFFFSSFSPATILRSFAVHTKQSGAFRKILVVVQFTAAVVLIVVVLVMTQQLRYIKAKNLGFDKENIVMLELQNEALGKNIEPLKSALQQVPGVVSLSGCGSKLAGDVMSFVRVPEKGKTSRLEYAQNVDTDYARTMGLTLVSGKWFSNNPAENIWKYIVNEAEFERLKRSPKDSSRLESDVLGVVKNFHFSSLKDPIEPIVLNTPYYKNDSGVIEQHARFTHIAVRLQKGNHVATIAAMEAAWKKVAVNEPFDVSFLDDDLQAMYVSETRMANVVNVFGGIALLVSCLGLLGLTAFTVERRTKEIGIRKVLGASVASIIALLSTDFLKLVLAAIVIATPLAYWAAGKWLQDFAYRVELSWWVFAGAGVLAVAIAFATVAAQAWRAARANPVDALRSE
jgi:putative ABC transport system permease protein